MGVMIFVVAFVILFTIMLLCRMAGVIPKYGLKETEHWELPKL